MLIIFMFLIGTAGSTAVSNVAGTIADLFGDVDGAGQAMALFVVSANVGPSLGSPVGAWIIANESLGYKWIFLINVSHNFLVREFYTGHILYYTARKHSIFRPVGVKRILRTSWPAFYITGLRLSN
jgi:MFS family permease